MAVLAAMMDQAVIPVFYDPDVEKCTNVIPEPVPTVVPSASGTPTVVILPPTFYSDPLLRQG